jgi:DNA repair photolyase
MLGYLYGCLSGDGTIGKYEYRRKKSNKNGRRNKMTIISFRLAAIDREMILTAKKYLSETMSIITQEFTHTGGLYAIRTSKKRHHHLLRFFLTRWNPCQEFTTKLKKHQDRARGFLSGIFDAEGGPEKNGTNLRIHNTDNKLLTLIEKSMDRLGFKHKREKNTENLKKKCFSIRLLGGRHEYIRFFSTVCPKIARKFRLSGSKLKHSIKIDRISKVSRHSHRLIDIETTSESFIGNGCVAHNCFARWNAVDRFHQVKSAEDWKNMKVRLGDIIKGRGKKSGTVMFPSTHDITPSTIGPCLDVLQQLLRAGNNVLVVSKPHLSCITEICEKCLPYSNNILFRFTIGAMDDKILKYWEPGAPAFQERFKSLQYAYKMGYPTSVSMEPLLDADNVVKMFNKLKPYVTNSIWIGKLNKLDARVKIITDEDRNQANRIEKGQTNEKIKEIYKLLKKEPLVKWKESYKEVLGLKLAENEGMDE